MLGKPKESIPKQPTSDTSPATLSPRQSNIPLDTVASSSSSYEEFLIKFLPYFAYDSSDALNDSKQFAQAKKQILDDILSKTSALCHEHELFPEYKKGTIYTLDNLSSWIKEIRAENIRDVCQAQISQLIKLLEQQELRLNNPLYDVENVAHICLDAIQACEDTSTSSSLEEKKLKTNEHSKKAEVIRCFDELLNQCHLNGLISERPTAKTILSENIDQILNSIAEEITKKQTHCDPAQENHIMKLGETLTAITKCFDHYKKLQGLKTPHLPSPTKNSLTRITRLLSQEKKASADEDVASLLDKVIEKQEDVIKNRSLYQQLEKSAAQYESLIWAPWRKYLRAQKNAGIFNVGLGDKSISHKELEQHIRSNITKLKKRLDLSERLLTIEKPLGDLFAMHTQMALEHHKKKKKSPKYSKLASSVGLSFKAPPKKTSKPPEIIYTLQKNQNKH
jgi:hypothetical protein